MATSVNVLADRHQAGLYHSLQLMARRFGWTLYTPRGMDWWDEGYWNFGRYTYPDARLAEQYLVGAAHSPDEEFPDWPIEFVTLDEARAMPWAFVIASLQDNQQGFDRYARETGARLIFQVGNTGQQIDWGREPLVLNSSEMPLLGRGIVYHQEFDSERAFGYSDPSIWAGRWAPVRCFVHLLDQTVCFGTWQAFGRALHDRDALRYGHAPVEPDPTYVENAKPIDKIANLMRASSWGWHDKPHGDGFGHVLHGWAAIGRPLIGHASHYQGKMGEIFWRDMETCIDLDRHSVEEAAQIVQTISAEDHAAMCRRIRAIFDEHVDYDAEAARIAEFLDVPLAVPA